jgi:hypothetical protein
LRTITAAGLAEIAKRLGTEPINFIAIEWVDDQPIYYADKELAFARSKIISLSNLEQVLKFTSGSPTSEVSVTLDDTDNELYGLMNEYNIHKRPCAIYQTFEGFDFEDAFLIFKGEIVTPVIWDEGERTVSINVMSQIESEEVGFSPEEGQFEFVSDELVGRTWPLCFGKVVHVPATKSTQVKTGTTTTAIGLPDQSLPYKANILAQRIAKHLDTHLYLQNKMSQAENIARPPAAIHSDYLDAILEEDELKQELADLSEDYEDVQEALEELQDAVPNLDAQQLAFVQADIDAKVDDRNDLVDEIKSKNEDLLRLQTLKEILEVELENAEYEYQVIGEIRERLGAGFQLYYNDLVAWLRILTLISEQNGIPTGQVNVLGGDKFPQGTQVVIVIDNVAIRGSFNGTLFTVSGYEPMYHNIQLSSSQPTALNAFDIVDSSTNLAGHYLLLNSGRICQVSRQVGNRCYIELIEAGDSTRDQDPDNSLGAAGDLLPSTWHALRDTNEYTEQEKLRIYENAIEETANGDRIKELRENIRDIVDLLQNAANDDDRRIIKTALFENVTRYNELVSDVRLPVTIEEKAESKISKSEFTFLLKAENLHYLEVVRSMKGPYGNVQEQYLLTADEIRLGINSSSAILLPGWLSSLVVQSGPPSTLWIAQPGSSVTLYSDRREKYIANIIPSTVHSVYAYKGVNGIRKLVPVPSDYYTVNEAEPIGSMTATTITLDQPLTSYAREDWEDGIYVTLTSSVGPNPADVMKWIIENYTNLEMDPTSHSINQAKLAKYPTNFALLEKPDAIALVEDIAWQSRCVAYSKGSTFYIKYLSSKDTSVAIIRDEDIEEESLKISLTDTEDIVTKFTAEWKPNYAVQEPNKTIVRHNIERYGDHEQTYDFFVYNIQSLVEKSATFWTIRKSNTWKKVQFKTFLTKLVIETWDTITLDLDVMSIDAIVEKADYDSSNGSLNVICWVPIRSGETTEYDFAHPSDLTIDTEFPTEEDIAGGNAGNPRNFPVGGGGGGGIGGTGPNGDPIIFRPKDYGRQFMSDLFDTDPPDPTTGYGPVNYKSIIGDPHSLEQEQNISKELEKELQNKGNRQQERSPIDSRKFKAHVVSEDADNFYTVMRGDGVTFEAHWAHGQPLIIDQIVQVYYNHRTQRYEVDNRYHQMFSYKIVSVEMDHLVCSYLAGPGDDFNVAKPHNLQARPYDGKVVNGIFYSYSDGQTREASKDGVVENQVIVPEYLVDDIIQVTKVHGGAGVVVNGVPLRFIDSNTAGRAWALTDS